MVLCLISSHLRRLVLFTAELLQQSMEVFVAVFTKNVAELVQNGVDHLFQREISVVIVEIAQTKEDILTAIYVHTVAFGPTRGEDLLTMSLWFTSEFESSPRTPTVHPRRLRLGLAREATSRGMRRASFCRG